MAQWKVDEKTFLITGGASGLGALYAEAFLNEGAKHVAIADINEQAGKGTAARLNSTFPGKVTFFHCDVSSEEQISRTFDETVGMLGQLDVMINNAGIMVDNPKLWRTACDVNWQGLVSFTMRAQKHMSKDEGGAGGTIINISSIGGMARNSALPIYCGSKAAVLHFSLCLSGGGLFEQTGVRVLTICPGLTDTPLLQGLKDRAYNEVVGEELVAFDSQKPESAAAACVEVFKNGAPGSVWLSHRDKPAEDITPIIEKHHKEYSKLIFE